MTTLLAIAALALLWAGLTWLCIWADAKDQAAYDRWYDSPDRIWNQHRSASLTGAVCSSASSRLPA